MIIPSFEVYCTLKPEQKAAIRQHMRALGMKPYHGNLGKPNLQKGCARPELRGPQPPRPHTGLLVNICTRKDNLKWKQMLLK
ncbi:hypothetical protein EB118_16950 [bacterium]|nr:hypothetical protein [bacterium]